jgi:hypothetical protein
MQNQHPAPSTQQAERSWLSTRDESRSVPVNFPEIDKGIKLLDKTWNLPGGTRQFRICG